MTYTVRIPERHNWYVPGFSLGYSWGKNEITPQLKFIPEFAPANYSNNRRGPCRVLINAFQTRGSINFWRLNSILDVPRFSRGIDFSALEFHLWSMI